jgi:hypothetical protein
MIMEFALQCRVLDKSKRQAREEAMQLKLLVVKQLDL